MVGPVDGHVVIVNPVNNGHKVGDKTGNSTFELNVISLNDVLPDNVHLIRLGYH